MLYIGNAKTSNTQSHIGQYCVAAICKINKHVYKLIFFEYIVRTRITIGKNKPRENKSEMYSETIVVKLFVGLRVKHCRLQTQASF